MGKNSYRNWKENKELGEGICQKVINAVRLIVRPGVQFSDGENLQFDAYYN